MNTFQIQAFIKSLRKKERSTNEKTKYVDKANHVNSGSINIVGVNSFIQTKHRNETTKIQQSEVTKRKQ